MQNRQNITYVKKADSQDITKIIKAVALPAGVFFLVLFTVSILKGMGSKLVAPLVAAMWSVGVIVSFWLPSHRRSVLNETVYTIGGYCLTLLMFWKMIALTSGVSASMLMATFDQPIATATGNAVPGYLANALYLTSALVPISFICMQGKRLLQFRRVSNRNRVLDQLRSIRK